MFFRCFYFVKFFKANIKYDFSLEESGDRFVDEAAKSGSSPQE